MKILVELAEEDKGTPIEMAGAIIEWYENRGTLEEDMVHAYNCLAAISKHINVYLEHDGLAKLGIIRGVRKGE